MTVERNVKGLLGTKLGMTQLWDDNNRIVPVTVSTWWTPVPWTTTVSVTAPISSLKLTVAF